MKLDYSSKSKQEFSAAKMVVMTDQEIGFGSMRESNFVAQECGGLFGNFCRDGSFSNGGFCRITVNGGFFLS